MVISGTTELAGLGNSCLRLRSVQAVQVLERRDQTRQVNWRVLSSDTAIMPHGGSTGTSLAFGDNLASIGQGTPTRLAGVNQPTFISCVGDGADKLTAFQSNFEGFLLDPRI